MNKKKVLFILHSTPPVHGAAKVGDTIIESEVINNEFITKNIKIKSSLNIDQIGQFNWLKIYFFIELFAKVCTALIVFRPKVIYYTASPQGFAFYRDVFVASAIKIYRSLKRVEVFYHYHARGIREFTLQSNLKRKLTNYFVKNTHLIFISELLKLEVEHLNGYASLSFLPNGVESPLNRIELNEVISNRIEKGQVKVLYLSNMIKEKGYDVVLNLAKYFKENSIKGNFDFAGAWASKEDESYFNEYVKVNKLEGQVLHHGLVQGSRKEQLFSKATLFIFPSSYKREVFPLAVLEALSFGLPVLAFNIGALTRIINSKVGMISDRNCIFEDIKEMVSNYQTEEVYIKCWQEYLNNYTTEVFEKNLLSILKSNNA